MYGAFSVELNMCSGSLLQMENLSGMKKCMRMLLATTSVYYFYKTKGKGMLFVGPFVPLSQMATVAIEIMVNCLDFIVKSHK